MAGEFDETPSSIEPEEHNRDLPEPEGRDEMNLAEFPFASLRTVGDSRTSIVHEGWIQGKDGARHYQKWIVEGSSRSGLPTEYDERVYVALMKITQDQGFASRKVPFSVYQVLKIMGSDTHQQSYQSVEDALKRLVGVTVFAEGAFWDNKSRDWVNAKSGFHLIERFWLRYRETNERVKEEEGVPAYIVWSEDIWASIQAGYIKRLNLNFFYNLETPLARRLYRFLDKRMHYRSDYEIDIFELASRLGMARYDKPSEVKRKLQPALDELKAKHFLTIADLVKRNGYTRIRFVRPQQPAAGQPVQAELPLLSATDDTPRRPEDALWEQLLKHLAAAMTRATYNSVFPRTQLLALEDGVARIGVPNQATQDVLAHRLDPVLREAFHALGHPIQELTYIIIE